MAAWSMIAQQIKVRPNKHSCKVSVVHNPAQSARAKAASRKALEAQYQVQEAMRRVYAKPMAAQQKAKRASVQVVTEQELAKRVAARAAAQAAYIKPGNVQKGRASNALYDTNIAQKSARSAPASFSANELGSQQEVSIPSCQLGFFPNSSAVHDATVQPAGRRSHDFRWLRSSVILL